MIATIKYDDHSGNFIVTLEPADNGQRETMKELMQLIQHYDENDAIEGRTATVYSEIDQIIYGVTDEPDGSVMTTHHGEHAPLIEIRIF